MATTTAAGGGWFKIWESGYDASAGKWCTEKFMANNGLLSVQLPEGLPAGYYLVRPELLALHNAQSNDPQFYVGCAQIFVQGPNTGSKLVIPAGKEAQIPGYVAAGQASVSFNIYNTPLRLPYKTPGPPVFFPNDTVVPAASVPALQQTQGVIPSNCLLKNANWCGVEVSSYKGEAACYSASDACFKQEDSCFKTAPPSGDANCELWDAKCEAIQNTCTSGRSASGPPNAGKPLAAVPVTLPGPIPPVLPMVVN
jgi:hypothetical protein